MPALPFLGAGFSVLSGVAGFQNQRAQAAYYKMQGNQAMAVANEEASRSRYQSKFQLGAIRAQAGAQGTTFAGSPMTSYLESAKQAELQAQDIIYGGFLKKQQANYQAKLAQRSGLQSLFGGIAGGVGSLATSFAGGFGAGSAGTGGGNVYSSLLSSGWRGYD